MVVAAASTLASILILLSVPLLYFMLVTILREGSDTRAEGEDFT